ncbi:myb-like protein X [Artemia franciscana]|uniref:Uncharacterized protein n=1 Tax=Artemia franciscana TaxID=6661 RepID=A0AA88LGN1_ARTSF|nr:hypothetical protein QYM36_004708 [Artemia franciscana]
MGLKVIFLLSIYIFSTLAISIVKRADVQTSTSTERVDIHRTITPSPGNPITGEEHYHSESSKLSVTASPKIKRYAFKKRRADVQTSTSTERFDEWWRSKRFDEQKSSSTEKNIIYRGISPSPGGPGVKKTYNTLPPQQKKKRSASKSKREALKNKRSNFQTSTSTEKVDIHREITPSPENPVSGEVNYHFESKKIEGTSAPKIKRYLNNEESHGVDMLGLLQHSKTARFIRSPQDDQSTNQNEVDGNSNKDEGRRLDEDRQRVEDEKKKIKDERKKVEDEKRELEKQKEKLHEEEDRNKKERDDIEQKKKELEERKKFDDGQEGKTDSGESRKYEDEYDQDGDKKPVKKKGDKGKKGDGKGEDTQEENDGEPEGDGGKGKGGKKPTKKKEEKDEGEDQENEKGEEPEEEEKEEDDDGKKKPKGSKQKPGRKKDSKDKGYYRAQRPNLEEDDDECDYFIYIIQPEPARPKPRPNTTPMQQQRPSQRPQWWNSFRPQQIDYEQENQKPSQTPSQPSRPSFSQPQMNGWNQESTPMGQQGYPFSWNQWAGQRRPGQSSSWSQPNRRPSQSLGSYGFPYGYSGLA